MMGRPHWSTIIAIFTAACGGSGGTGPPGINGKDAGADATAGSAGLDAGFDAGGSGGTAGTGGTGGMAGMAGMAGAGGSGDVCGDLGPEPNETEALANPACGVAPCEASDCDKDGSTGFGGPLAPVTGTIGPGDTDFLRFKGKDKLGLCTVNAVATTKDSGFRLCAFAACDKSGTKLNGCSKGTIASSPNQLPGCCVEAPGTVELNHDCTSSATDDDSATIYIRVDEATVCSDYTVDYHF